MQKPFAALTALLGVMGASPLPACAPDTIPALSQKHAPQDLRLTDFLFPPAFERERGVSWDGQIGWKTPSRVWVFAAALEQSLKGIVRTESPYRLNVAVVRVDQAAATFVVEFSIQNARGERLEMVQVEGTGPINRSVDEVFPAVAGEIVTLFKTNVLQ